jgi:peptidoglycan/LPS O-acetylase OafA/YrhL
VAFVGLAISLVAAALAHGLDRFWLAEDFLGEISTGVLFLGLLGPLFASLLLVGYTDDGPIIRLLEWSPIRHLGRVSYGLYLYRWPVLAAVEMIAARQEIPIEPMIKGLVVFPLTIIVAILSFEFIERPLLALKGKAIWLNSTRGKTS